MSLKLLSPAMPLGVGVMVVGAALLKAVPVFSGSLLVSSALAATGLALVFFGDHLFDLLDDRKDRAIVVSMKAGLSEEAKALLKRFEEDGVRCTFVSGYPQNRLRFMVPGTVWLTRSTWRGRRFQNMAAQPNLARLEAMACSNWRDADIHHLWRALGAQELPLWELGLDGVLGEFARHLGEEWRAQPPGGRERIEALGGPPGADHQRLNLHWPFEARGLLPDGTNWHAGFEPADLAAFLANHDWRGLAPRDLWVALAGEWLRLHFDQWSRLTGTPISTWDDLHKATSAVATVKRVLKRTLLQQQ